MFLFLKSFSQNFKNYEFERLKSFEINTNSIDLNNSKQFLDLKSILKKDQNRKTYKTIAIVLTTLSLSTITYGSKIIKNSINDKEGLGASIGVMIVTAGVVELGVSIPLYINSNKKRKERNSLIELYKKNEIKELSKT